MLLKHRFKMVFPFLATTTVNIYIHIKLCNLYLSVCFSIITLEPLDRFASNFDRGARECYKFGFEILSGVGRLFREKKLKS